MDWSSLLSSIMRIGLQEACASEAQHHVISICQDYKSLLVIQHKSYKCIGVGFNFYM
jgi:hypothetical protein